MGAMSVSQFRVDLSAISHNLRCVRQQAGRRAVLVAVKANAYGHGAVAVSRHIQDSGLAEMLGVAHVGEGRELRDAGITMPVLKFTPALPDELEAALAADLALTVADAASIDQAQTAASEADRTVKVHLKLDTGMGRVGAPVGDAVRLARRVAQSSHLELDGVFTHLPSSDTRDGEEFTRAQLGAFEAACGEIEGLFGPVPHVSAANSGAILLHDLGATSLVRPGVMVYGCYPDANTPRTVDLAPVATWTSRLGFVKQVRAGETVGYGRTWTAPCDTWIGTVLVGYGDGYSRKLSNTGRMLIDGVSYPIAGRVCMDQTMIDLGPQEPQVAVGDEVVLLGASGHEEITVAELAEVMGTITYEVTCLVAPRVGRVHRP